MEGFSISSAKGLVVYLDTRIAAVLPTCLQIFIFHNESGFYQRLGANASDTSIVIDNIAKDITYSARIQAHNRAGSGVLSDVVFVGKTQGFCCLVKPSTHPAG